MDLRQQERQLEQLGTFEISNAMLDLARHNEKSNTFLNAGRGNPNWINTKGRLAFAHLVTFGVHESQRTFAEGDLAGAVETAGIQQRLASFLKPAADPIDAFILDAVAYGQRELKLDADEFVAELANGVIGNNYPVPSRVLVNSERVLNAYLAATLYRGVDLAKKTTLFPTEGGTAAIVYIFNSLKENKLLQPSDKIAINAPIFTPYLQIPALNDYDLVEVDLQSTEANNWEIQASEIDKLNDSDIKALFVVNPSNPGAMAFNDQALAEIKKVVAKNPDLLIITDDVYGTFVDQFQSVYAVAPHNTLLVYSYSKLFGATGWRLGTIAVQQDNVFDRLIRELPAAQQAVLNKRYAINVVDPAKMKFIDRLVADSRSVGLYHTAGLSTPQQIMMVLFSLAHLLTATTGDPYEQAATALISQRYHDLWQGLGLPENTSRENSKYYALIDIYQLAEVHYGRAFRDYLADNFEQVDFLYRLSQKNGVVLMDGVGFGTNAGELRVSEANLPTAAYKVIPQQILELLAEYHHDFVAS